MPQQINLCTPILLTQKRYFSARTMLQAVAVFVVLGGVLCTSWVTSLNSASVGFKVTLDAQAPEMASLQAAVAADAPVVPVGLRFVDKATGATSFAPSYIGDETLLGSIWRTLSAPAIEAVVTYGEPELAGERDRRTWTQHLHDTVDQLRKA